MRIVFEFLGGPRDGERLGGTVEDGIPLEAACLYEHSDKARVGARFWCTCEYAVTALRTIPWMGIEELEREGYRFQGHIYEVVERSVEQRGLHVRVRHLCASE